MRIKAKYLQDKKENGGFALRNLIIHYQALALTWIKEWCLLLNYNNLNLEGHDLSGWHHYLWMEGKNPSFFYNSFSKEIFDYSLAKIKTIPLFANFYVE